MNNGDLSACQGRRGRPSRPQLLLTFMVLAPSVLGGCATLSHVAAHPAITGMGLVSLAVTGKGLADHALDMVTRRDCRILEGLVKTERAVCERPGSLATADDFRGLLSLGQDEDGAAATALALDTRLDGPGGTLVAAAKAPDGSRPRLRLALSTSPPSGSPTGPPRRPREAETQAVALLQ